MKLTGTCPKCGLEVKVPWKDRPEDKGVGRRQTITCPICYRMSVEICGVGGTKGAA